MKAEIKVKGMVCKSCETLIEETLKEIGVKVGISLSKGIVKVEFDETKVNIGDIKEAIQGEGYKVV